GFAANGTNPDVLIALEAVGEADDKKPPQSWRYGVVCMTAGGVTVKLDKAEVFTRAYTKSPGGQDNWTYFWEGTPAKGGGRPPHPRRSDHGHSDLAACAARSRTRQEPGKDDAADLRQGSGSIFRRGRVRPQGTARTQEGAHLRVVEPGPVRRAARGGLP